MELERGALAAGPPPPCLPSLIPVALGPVPQPFSKKLQYQGILGWLFGKGMEHWDSESRLGSAFILVLASSAAYCLIFKFLIVFCNGVAISGVSDGLGWCC